MEFRVTRSSQFFDDEKPKNIKEIYEKNNNWYVKINTLEELIAFELKYGALIISKNWDNQEEMEIEIYDDYRE